MVLAVLIFIIGIYLFYLKLKNKEIYIEERTKEVTALLSKFLMVAPIIGVVVFSILLTTVLQGRFAERSSHALIVFALWVYATSFYVEILKYYKNKSILMTSAVGCAISTILAIILTPLDRYCTIMYSYLHGYTFILGFCLIAFFYIGYLIKRK